MPTLRSPWLAGTDPLPGKLLGRLCLHTATMQSKSKTRQYKTRQEKGASVCQDRLGTSGNVNVKALRAGVQS